MAFNLNKNDGSQQNDPAHKSKFDLSKNDAQNVGTSSKKPPYLILILLVLIILGGTAWYFTSRSTNGNVAKNDSTSLSTAKLNQDTSQSSTSVTMDSLTGKIEGDSLSVKALVSTDSLPTVAASFHKGSGSIARISRSVVKDIVKLSKTNGTINVNGYASSEGDLAVNQKISQMRADSFKKYLVSKGVNENRITAIGKGIDNPIASNDTEVGRQRNRRVEIVIQ